MEFWTAIVLIMLIIFVSTTIQSYFSYKRKKSQSKNTKQNVTDQKYKKRIQEFEERIQNIEIILDDELPDWRDKLKKYKS